MSLISLRLFMRDLVCLRKDRPGANELPFCPGQAWTFEKLILTAAVSFDSEAEALKMRPLSGLIRDQLICATSSWKPDEDLKYLDLEV